MTRPEFDRTVRAIFGEFTPQSRIDALREALEGWEDISTAPKDGTAILVCLDRREHPNLKWGHIRVAAWRRVYWYFPGNPGFYQLDSDLVAWMRLPDPPHSKPDQKGHPDADSDR